jgi:hypothetical protein
MYSLHSDVNSDDYRKQNLCPLLSTAMVSHVDYGNNMLKVNGDHISSYYYSWCTDVPS